ncbi:hypothetical protein BDA96_08G207500 [Sorghum bicolor]|uniref:Purple acid phosphatase n=1 Tax=Sorghum bicolor TaxID=4558 RepID=A0A921U8T5_SORBI|nr:hypothetical protein BDA96_08G207500 [Sorghum bicolor]
MHTVAIQRRRHGAVTLLLVAAAVVLLSAAAQTAAAHRPRGCGVTSKYVRKHQASEDMPLDADVFAVPPGRNAPQQVHIGLADQTGTSMFVSWVTVEAEGNSTVLYGLAADKLDLAAEGTITRYTYYNYTSGYIHHATLTNLQHGTRYHYAVGVGVGDTVRAFWFTTPPAPGPDVPLRLGLIGDLGQTADSNSTLAHYESHQGDAVLFVGDLSYADKHPLHDNNRWDTWGRFAERSVAYQPWVWTTGNHEVDFAPELGELAPFKPFTHRYPTPWKASQSSEPYWYSVKLGPAHIIVLSSYSAFGKYTPQYKWVEAELKRVDREVTPWLFISTHVPWYNSNNFHYVEGLADELTWPQPAYSAFREYSFGHAVLDIKNRTHAYYAWYRNHDGNKVTADTMWFTNRYHMPNHDDSMTMITAKAAC